MSWHLRIAAWRRRTVRARRAAWAAFLAAVAGALAVALGTPSWFAPVFTASSAIVVALLPVIGADAWAFAWITSQRGLGYLTAFESRQRDDPYGFGTATMQRTLARLRDARAPSSDAWWMPPLVAAVLVSLATPWLSSLRGLPPAVPAVAGVERPGGQAGGDEPGTGDEASGSDAEGGAEVAGAPDERSGEQPDDAASAPDTRAEEGADGDGSGAQDAAVDGDALAQGGAAVDRFLRELERARDGGANPFDPADAPPTSDDGARSARELPDAPVGDRPRSGDEPPNSASEEAGDEAGDQAGGEGGASGSPGDAESGSARPDGQGEGSTRSGSEREGAGEDGGASGASPAGDPSRARQPGGGEAGAAEAEEDRSAAEPEASGAGGAGEEDQSLARSDEGSSGGEAAGAAPGEEGAAEPLPGSPEGPADRLQSDGEGGAAPTVGSVRGGGAAPEVVPEGQALSPSDARSAERAAEEQGLPGVYREIIRRYFR